jgi:sporulation protein YlmC with PRC-barrel domain
MSRHARVLVLTEHLGQDVRDAGGARVGRLADLAVQVDGDTPRVTGLLVRPGGRRRLAFFDWEDVARFERAEVRLRPGAAPTVPGEARRQLWVMRDVVDSQIVDVHGRRVVRAADALLRRHGMTLELVGLDVGLGSLLRRLGPRRPARGSAREVIAWRDVSVASSHELRLLGDYVHRRRYPHRKHRRHAPG